MAALLFVSSAAAVGSDSVREPGARQQAGVATTAAITEAYAVQFYPLWFTYFQYQFAPHNQLVGPDRISPIYQIVVAINDDTLYASSIVDVSAEPAILTIPETSAGYSVLHTDPYGTVFAGVPSKPSGTVLPETVYALVPQGYAGMLPAGAISVEMPLDRTGMIFRVDKYSPTGVDQTEEATQFRAALRLQSLSDYLADPTGGTTNILPEAVFAVPFKTTADTLLRFQSIEFLSQLQTAVHSDNTPPLTPEEQALSDAFDARFGTGGSSLDPAGRIPFIAGARSAYDAIQNNYLENLGPNNWIHFTNMGAWGDQVLDRASITEFIQYGNTIQTAAYYHTFRDASGASLDGSTGGYVLTFPPGGQPPAERFWSLTAYTPETVELIPNPADKYLVARYTPGLQTNDDGSLSIYVSQTKPPGVPEANWLPVSDRPFNLMLRVYGVQAGSSVANNTYVPPAVVSTGPFGGASGGETQCDPLVTPCGLPPADEPDPTLAPNPTADSAPAVGSARMPNLRATATARWHNRTIRVNVRVLISKPRLVDRWFHVRVRIPALDATKLVRVSARGRHVRVLHLGFSGSSSVIGKQVIATVDPTDRILETRNRDNFARARIR